jgi:nucleotide-binding universal stress UspA family protein
MNKILVPVDFSDTSLNALSYAIQLFGDSEVEFTVLHTYEVSTGAFRMKSIDWILEEDAQREMDALVKRMQREEPGVVLKTKIMKSNAVSAITSLGNSGSYDFIIMGTKGASGLISKTKAPVLVVPSNYLYQSWNEIVFAIGNIPLSSASVVNPLRELAMLHSCKINVLHIAVDEKLDYLEEVLSTIEDLSPSVIYTFGAGNINERLNDYLTENDTSLLCLIRSKKDFFSRIFDESVTLKQTFNSPIPLLILHN